MAPESSLSSEEKAEIELRRRVENILSPKLREDKTLFLRFLIARNYDLDQAETMLRNHINWRKVHKVDTILSDYEYPKCKDVYFAQTRLGFDKHGSRVVYIDIGNMDLKGLTSAYKKQELLRYVVYTNEDDLEQMRIHNAQNEQQQYQKIYIFNMENFSVPTSNWKGILELFSEQAQQNDLNYPERMKTAFVINASSLFTIAWSALKPFVAQRTQEKMRVFGTDGWKEELLKIIDADTLPVFLGGTRTDPDGDPMCRTFVYHGLVIPEKYYVDQKATSLVQNPNAKKLVIARRSKSEVKLEILHPNSKIELEFELKNYDIGFSLLYKETASEDSKVTELVPFQRVVKDLSPEQGMFMCEKRGIYLIVFDNTYSWVHRKEIHYIVSVVAPNNTKNIS